MNTLKVALVPDWLTNSGGAEQLLLALHELYPDAPIYTSLYLPEKVPQFNQAKVITSFLQKIPGGVTRHQFLIPLMPQAFEAFDLKGFDVVVSIGNGIAKGVITQPGQVHICYCNTPQRYLWNLGADQRNKGRLDSGIRAWAEHRLRLWDVVSAERVDQFIANSHNVERRIAKIYRRKSRVIYPPVDTNKYTPSFKDPADYFLSVGRLVSYKRIDLIIQACLAAKKKLKIVGSGPEEEKLKKLAEGAEHIEFLGRLPDSDLQKLYQDTRGFIFAAEEDFGIVPVEAMSAGRPVIAFKKGGAVETIKDRVTGEFFTEQSVKSLVEVLEGFSPDDYDPEVIRTHAQAFDTSVYKEKMANFIAQAWEDRADAYRP